MVADAFTVFAFFEVAVALASKGFGVEIGHKVRAYLHKIDMFPELFYLLGVLKHFYIAGIDNLCHTTILIT